MPHKVTVNKALTALPNGLTYGVGQVVILDDHEFASLSGTCFTDGTLTDGGSFPPVAGYQSVVDEQVLNGQLYQLGNAVAPIRFTVRRQDVNTDSASALGTGAMTLVAIPLYAGDVISRITYKTGATAPTTTAGFVALYAATGGAPLSQSAGTAFTSTVAANTVYDTALTAPQTITSTGIYYIGLSLTGTVASLPCSVIAPAGLASGLLSGQAVLSQNGGSALGNVAPTLTGGPNAFTGYSNSTYVPYVLAH